MKKAFLILTLTLFSIAVFATDVSGSQSGVWTVANSPYNIVGNIEVPEGTTLQIEPGVTVIAMGNYRLNALGTISAVGTPADSIRFESGMADPTALWKGIRIENPTLASTFTHVYVEKAEMGINCLDSPATISHSRFYKNEKGIRLYGMGNPNPAAMDVHNNIVEYSIENGILIHQNSNSHVHHNEVRYNGTGTRFYAAIQLSNQSGTGSNNPEINHNHIHHNFKQGISAWDITGGTAIAPYVHHNLIEYNLTGIYYLYASGFVEENIIRYNFVTGNADSGAGVMVAGASSEPYFEGNEIYGNFTGFYLGNNAKPVLGDLVSNHLWSDGGNQIYNNIDGNNVLHSVYCFSYTDASIVIKAENNYWGTNDPAQINIGINDHLDDPSLPLVDYDPWIDSPPNSTAISGTLTNPSSYTLENCTLQVVGATSGLALHSFPVEIGTAFNFTLDVDEDFYVVASAEVTGQGWLRWAAAGTLDEPSIFEPGVEHQIDSFAFHVMKNDWHKYTVGDPIQVDGRSIYPVYHQFFVFHWDYINWLYDEGDYRYIHAHTRYHEDGNTDYVLAENAVYYKIHNLNPNDTWTQLEFIDDQGTTRTSNVSYLLLEDGIIVDKVLVDLIVQVDTETGKYLSLYEAGQHFLYDADGYCNEMQYYDMGFQNFTLQTGTQAMSYGYWNYMPTPSRICYEPNSYLDEHTLNIYWIPPHDDHTHQWTHYNIYAGDVLIASTDGFTPFISLADPVVQGAYYTVRASDGTNESPHGDGLLVPPVSNDDPIMPPTTLSVYPNPFSGGQINIKLDDPLKQSGSFSIYNLRGQKVYTEKFAKDAGAELFWNGKDQKGRNCSSGIYLLKVNLRDGRGFTKRMVKM